MTRSSSVVPDGVVLVVLALVMLAVVPGIAVAEQRGGGAVVVEEGETVTENLTAFGGAVIVSGTVEGDLSAYGGNVVIEPSGEVMGSVETAAGDVRIAGTVAETVNATGGRVVIAETASIDGDLRARGGPVVVAGSVGGDATLNGQSVTLESPASINGNIEYETGETGEFTNDGASVAGTVSQPEFTSAGGEVRDSDGGILSGQLTAVYLFLVTLLVGGLLVGIFPDTTSRVADSVQQHPLRTGGIGLLALFGTPFVAILFAITLIGIPVTFAGLISYALTLWIASIYGRYAVGAVVLSYAGVDSRWARLIVGLLIVALVIRLPVVGGLLEFGVLVFGLGAVGTLLYRVVRKQRESEPTEAPEPSATT